MPKNYEVPCAWGCGNTITTRRKPPAGLGCGRGECMDKHNAAVEAYNAAAEAARRARPRRPRQQAVVSGDWGMAAQLGMMGRRRP